MIEIELTRTEIGLNHPSVEEVKAQKKELFELGQTILELLQRNHNQIL
jgi:hypothetical protein